MAAFTSSDLERYLSKDSTTSRDAARVLKEYVQANCRNPRSTQLVNKTINSIEPKFPKFAAEFEYVHEKFGIPKQEIPHYTEWPPTEPVTKQSQLASLLEDSRCTDSQARTFLTQFAESCASHEQETKGYTVRKLDELEQQYPSWSSVIRSIRARQSAALTAAALNASGQHYVPPPAPPKPVPHPEVPPAYGDHKQSTFVPPSGPPPNVNQPWQQQQQQQQQQQSNWQRQPQQNWQQQQPQQNWQQPQQQNWQQPQQQNWQQPQQQNWQQPPQQQNWQQPPSGGWQAPSGPPPQGQYAHLPPPPGGQGQWNAPPPPPQQYQQYQQQQQYSHLPPPPPPPQAGSSSSSDPHAGQVFTEHGYVDADKVPQTKPALPGINHQIFNYVRPKW